MKLGIFGGTFNPIHFGHLRVAEEVRETAGLDRIIFIPSGTPPLKTEDIAPAHHRLAMTQRAIKGNPFFEMLDIECRSRQKSYTIKTLEQLQELCPGDHLFFMLGIDAFLDVPNWHRPDMLVMQTDFLVLSRPGFRFIDLSASPYLAIPRSFLRKLDTQTLESHTALLAGSRTVTLLPVSPVAISATDIRSRAAQRKSIKYLLPAEVESYIISENLYVSGKKRHRTIERGCR
ncbi:MAG TPA: nicotinate-nucleotide adenylyltransferase [Thermodesulfovibrionales bacterium]|nr:nicotinate-nucleotide adenylyltransferase [Thermodesulfovibrionales bacterium]